MRKGIIYLLMSIFLLFVAENNHRIDFQNLENQTTSGLSNSYVKQYHSVKSFEKEDSRLTSDFLGFPEETTVDDFNISSPLSIIILTTVTGLNYLFNLYFRRKQQFLHQQKSFFYSVRRFILLRSIRI